jgi:hypothetical protein
MSANKRLVPTRNGEAPLLAAQPQRWVARRGRKIVIRTRSATDHQHQAAQEHAAIRCCASRIRRSFGVGSHALQCQPPRRASAPSVACRALHKLSPLHAARQPPASHSVPFVSVTASHEQSLPHAASHASAFRACPLHVRPSSHTKLATQQRVQPDRQQAVACWFPRRARRGGGLTQR